MDSFSLFSLLSENNVMKSGTNLGIHNNNSGNSKPVQFYIYSHSELANLILFHASYSQLMNFMSIGVSKEIR